MVIKLEIEGEKFMCEQCKEKFRYRIACIEHERYCKRLIKMGNKI